MNDSYLFSRVKETDCEEVMALYSACRSIPGCTWSEYYPSQEEFDEDIAGGFLYCLKEGEKVIAVASLGDYGDIWGEEGIPWGKDIRRPCELARVGVRPEYAGKGIGARLLNLVIDTAKSKGFDGVRLMVSPGNAAAVALYRRAGFKTVGEADMYGIHWLCQELKL